MKTKGIVFNSARDSGSVQPDEVYDTSRSKSACVTTGATWARLSSGLWVQSFDGIGGYVTILDNVIFNLLNFTFICWIKRKSQDLVTEELILDRFDHTAGAGSKGWLFKILTNNKLQCNVETAIFLSVSQLLQNTWYHIAFTKVSAADYRWYINGILDSSGTSAQTTTNNSRNPTIGRYVKNNDSFLNSYLSRTMLFHTVYSASDVYQLFQSERSLFGV